MRDHYSQKRGVFLNQRDYLRNRAVEFISSALIFNDYNNSIFIKLLTKVKFYGSDLQ